MAYPTLRQGTDARTLSVYHQALKEYSQKNYTACMEHCRSTFERDQPRYFELGALYFLSAFHRALDRFQCHLPFSDCQTDRFPSLSECAEENEQMLRILVDITWLRRLKTLLDPVQAASYRVSLYLYVHAFHAFYMPDDRNTHRNLLPPLFPQREHWRLPWNILIRSDLPGLFDLIRFLPNAFGDTLSLPSLSDYFPSFDPRFSHWTKLRPEVLSYFDAHPDQMTPVLQRILLRFDLVYHLTQKRMDYGGFISGRKAPAVQGALQFAIAGKLPAIEAILASHLDEVRSYAERLKEAFPEGPQHLLHDIGSNGIFFMPLGSFPVSDQEIRTVHLIHDPVSPDDGKLFSITKRWQKPDSDPEPSKQCDSPSAAIEGSYVFNYPRIRYQDASWHYRYRTSFSERYDRYRSLCWGGHSRWENWLSHYLDSCPESLSVFSELYPDPFSWLPPELSEEEACSRIHRVYQHLIRRFLT